MPAKRRLHFMVKAFPLQPYRNGPLIGREFPANAHNLPAAVRLAGWRTTAVAILGRMASYSGKIVTWDEALGAQLDLSPKSYAWDAEPPVLPGADGCYACAMPGITKAC